MNDDEFSNMSSDQLRAALAQFGKESAPARAPEPPVPGCENLKPEDKEKASVIYARLLLAKPAGQLTDSEKSYLWAGIRAYSERGGMEE